MHSAFPRALGVPQAEPSVQPSPAQFLQAAPPPCWHPGQNYTSKPRALSGLISRCGHISPSPSVNTNPARVRLSAAAHANGSVMHSVDARRSQLKTPRLPIIVIKDAEWFNPPPLLRFRAIKGRAFILLIRAKRLKFILKYRHPSIIFSPWFVCLYKNCILRRTKHP